MTADSEVLKVMNDPSANCDEMDTDKCGTADEEGQQYLVKYQLFGPASLFTCRHYLMTNIIKEYVTEHIRSYLQEVFDLIISTDVVHNDVIKELQTFADKYALNLYMYTIGGDVEELYEIKSSLVLGDGKTFCAFLVYDQSRQQFYLFSALGADAKEQFMFLMNDQQTLQSFIDIVVSYDWSGDQQADTKKDKSHIVNNTSAKEVDISKSQMKSVLETSDLCYLLLNNVHSLIPFVGSQLDNITHFRFKSSDYQLTDDDHKSPEASNKALQKQLQLLSKLSNSAAELLERNRTTCTSVDSTDDLVTTRDRPATTINENILASASRGETPLPKVQLLNQPARVRRHRNLEELRDDHCPAVQIEGAITGKPLEFHLPAAIRDRSNVLYLGAHVTTYDGAEHDQRIPVSMNMAVKQNCNLKKNDLNCFQIADNQDNNCIFDQKTRGIFSKITQSEKNSLNKSWSFRTVNLYQDDKITKTIIKSKKLQWSRFKFAIYIKSSNGDFQQISPVTYSDLFVETTGNASIATNTIFPMRLCANGGQMIFVPLSEAMEKDDIVVQLNGEKLNSNKFAVSKQILSFESPACTQRTNSLIIQVNTHSSDCFEILYHPHEDGHPDPCGLLETN
ncbi:unnamed protein product [Adineta ricciae]|uniref:Uncharacterized protein n=1 Tax=Adineta ricciae TaxID=249248 RepID=A0A814G2H2_ADIRI|nr:unnamed protein product [Adineta ricciae]